MKTDKNKLPKKLKRDWIKALRSGKFKQGQCRLWNKEENTYCCLGVLGTLCGVKKLSDKSQEEFLGKGHPGYTKVPEVVRGESKIAMELANKNDNGSSFSEIADYIEENL